MKAKKLCKRNLFLAGLAAVVAAASVFAPFGGDAAKLSANANSGPSSWSGVTASGMVFTGENCPIEVESEVLTFNIKDLIHHGSGKEELLAYDTTFSAAYTFKNPTQNAVKATLAFPLGKRSDYGYWENGEGGTNDTYVDLDDLLADKYSVQVGGVPIDAQMRYTFHPLNDFDFTKESKRIYDGYREHEFFKRNMAVYIYGFSFASAEKDYFMAEATIKDCGDLRFGGNYGHIEKEKNKTTLSYSVKSGDNIKLYSIGGEIDAENIAWRFYKTSGYLGLIEKKVAAQAVYLPTDDVTTFEEYVFNGYTGGNDASKTERSDFYNAVLDYIDEYLETSMLPAGYKFLQDSSYMMRWLVYDLDFSAGQTIENTVSAPLFSGGLYTYSPYVYTYEYLLSPARNWSGFKNLEIRINTQYYLINSCLNFEKTDGGYFYKADGLPDGELEFEICSVENPERDNRGYGYVAVAVILIIGVILAILIPIVLIVVVIVVLVKRSNKSSSGRTCGKGGNGGFVAMNTFGDKDKTE